MEKKISCIIRQYYAKSWESPEPMPKIYVYIDFKSKVLKNYRYFITTSLHDHKLFILTYNADKRQWSLEVCERGGVTTINDEDIVYDENYDAARCEE